MLRVPGPEGAGAGLRRAGAAPARPAVVAGFPGGGPLQAVPARVRAPLTAQGKDIYGRGDVLRQVYSLRAQVRPGNSGGPLLSRDGEALGVVFAAGVDDPDTGYALTAGQVQAAAAAGRTATSGAAHRLLPHPLTRPTDSDGGGPVPASLNACVGLVE